MPCGAPQNKATRREAAEGPVWGCARYKESPLPPQPRLCTVQAQRAGVPAAAALRLLLSVGAQGEPRPLPRPSVPELTALLPPSGSASPIPSPVPQERPGGSPPARHGPAHVGRRTGGPQVGTSPPSCPEPQVVALAVSFALSVRVDVARALWLLRCLWCQEGEAGACAALPGATEGGGLSCRPGSHSPRRPPSRAPSPSCSWDAAGPRAGPVGLRRTAPLRREGARHPPGPCWGAGSGPQGSWGAGSAAVPTFIPPAPP